MGSRHTQPREATRSEKLATWLAALLGKLIEVLIDDYILKK